MKKKFLYQPFFIRLFHWEYWPFHVVYGPLYVYWLWLCIRSRSFFFFNTSNPGIKNGGFLMESKHSVYSLLPEKSYPPTLFFKAGVELSVVLHSVKRRRYSYPLVGKPDVGMKGLSVKKLDTEQELKEYISSSPVPFLIQEFVPFSNEVGIFYYRYPNENKGHISGIVGKEFLTVTGDGKSTILELLKKDKRYILQLPVLRKTHAHIFPDILAEGNKFVVVPYGNHVRGAKFIDLSHLGDAQLTATIDLVCRAIPGFYYGRLDIRYTSWEELRRGENFSIIELNGAGSEPTHIYDPRHSLFYAWKEIIRHWKILRKISRINYHPEQRPYMNTKEGLAMLRENKLYLKLITGMKKKCA